MVTERSKVLFC